VGTAAVDAPVVGAVAVGEDDVEPDGWPAVAAIVGFAVADGGGKPLHAKAASTSSVSASRAGDAWDFIDVSSRARKPFVLPGRPRDCIVNCLVVNDRPFWGKSYLLICAFKLALL
jgi:hypothetical protein